MGAVQAVLRLQLRGVGQANVAGFFIDEWTRTGDLTEGFRAGYRGRSVGSQKEVRLESEKGTCH